MQVTSVPELRGFLDQLGVNVIQIACGDPHHASWNEGDDMPAAARAAGFDIHAAMIGFPGASWLDRIGSRRSDKGTGEQ